MRNMRTIAIAAIIFASCRGAENKADTSEKENKVDTSATVITEPVEEKKPDTATSRTPETPASTSPKKSAKPNPDILSRIDEHLVSTPNFTAAPGGGISNATVTVRNTLTDISIQKALLEVSVRNADGSEVRTDYYNVINLGPGDSKQVNIPNTTKGSKLLLHIVKVKSDQLTNGEFVLTGSHAQK